MKNLTKTVSFALAVLVFATQAMADPILHIWSCKLNDGKTRADLMEVTREWTDAAKTITGGEDIEVSLEFPIAANVPDGSFNFILAIPNTRTWGIWEGNYAGSAAADVDEEWSEVASCSNSSLWNSVSIE